MLMNWFFLYIALAVICHHCIFYFALFVESFFLFWKSYLLAAVFAPPCREVTRLRSDIINSFTTLLFVA